MARSFNDLPGKQQWLVLGVLCLLLVGIYYMQFWRATGAQIQRMTTQILQLRAEIQEMQLVSSELPAAEAELSMLSQRLDILSNILPEEYETADLLRGVGALAAQSNLAINDLAFKDPVPYEFYAESPIELELTGSFHDLARFFDRIGKFARIINVNEVNIQAVDEAGSPTVRATVTAMTFIFLEDVEVPVEEGSP